MTLIEAGVIAGIFSGAMVGGLIAKSHGALVIAGGSVGGMISSGVAGWLFALLVIFLAAIIDALWRVAAKRPDSLPTDAELRAMTRTAIPLVFVGLLSGALMSVSFGWPQGAAAMLALAILTAFIAVARSQLRHRYRGAQEQSS